MGIVLKNVNITGGKLSNTSLPSPPCPDTDIEVNGVAEGSVVAGSTVDIQLSDSLGVVTPTSVTQVGNDFQIVLPDAPPAVTRSTATLMKTGQTTSYRTGDDGDLEAGRDTDFFTLDAAPLHNDGSATINTTTARFTDELGGSTYTNNIVLDWSTWNGSTLLGWYRLPATAGTQTWNNAIDNALATSIGSFTTGWRLPNNVELISLCDESTTGLLNYVPFSITSPSGAASLWTSTTNFRNTGQAKALNLSQNLTNHLTKTNLYSYIPVRTFSLSLLNVLS
jgi:hypothetical protein